MYVSHKCLHGITGLPLPENNSEVYIWGQNQHLRKNEKEAQEDINILVYNLCYQCSLAQITQVSTVWLFESTHHNLWTAMYIHIHRCSHPLIVFNVLHCNIFLPLLKYLSFIPYIDWNVEMFIVLSLVGPKHNSKVQTLCDYLSDVSSLNFFKIFLLQNVKLKLFLRSLDELI